MITMDIFLLGLLAVSVFTGLATEGVKKICAEHNIGYAANTLAGTIAGILAILIGSGYAVVAAIPFSASLIVYILALMCLSWICAMAGYDKVIQTLGQLNIAKKG